MDLTRASSSSVPLAADCAFGVCNIADCGRGVLGVNCRRAVLLFDGAKARATRWRRLGGKSPADFLTA